MNSTPEKKFDTDTFRPLHELKSPLTMNMVKNYIRVQMQAVTFWQRVQHIIFQNGMIVIAGGLVFFQHSSAGELRGGMKFMPEVNGAHFSKIEIVTPESSMQQIPVVATNEKNISIGTAEEIIGRIKEDDLNNEIGSTINKIDLATIKSSSFIVPPRDHFQNIISQVPRSEEQNTYPISLFAEAKGAMLFDHVRMYGGGFSFGLEHDWQIATVRFIAATGLHDERKDPPTSLLNVMRIKGETMEELDITFGGVTEIGRFIAGIQIGPSLANSAITSGIKGTPSSNIITPIATLGLASEISAGYKLNDLLSANISGLLRYHTNFSGGILMSLTIHP